MTSATSKAEFSLNASMRAAPLDRKGLGEALTGSKLPPSWELTLLEPSGLRLKFGDPRFWFRTFGLKRQ